MTGRWSEVGPERDERGQTTIMIVGFCVVLLMAFVLVVDASAAYLQRNSLNSIADGAALVGADAAVQGDQVYTGGLDEERLELAEANASREVGEYLAEIGARAKYPGLDFGVAIDANLERLDVTVTAPIRFPVRLPDGIGGATIEANGAASVFTGD